MSKKLRNLLANYPSLSYNELTKKVSCCLSGHEMPYREDAIRSYVNGRKFLKLQAGEDKNFEQYKPHLVPSTKRHHENQLFCALTMTHVNKTPVHVERHVNGAKFKRYLARWEDCQKNGTEYRPPRGRRKVQENLDMKKGVHSTDEGGANDEGELSDTDSLSDLYHYPAVDGSEETMEATGSGQAGENEGSDLGFEEMESEDTKQMSQSTPGGDTGQKRNNFKEGRHHKQKKKKMQKVS